MERNGLKETEQNNAPQLPNSCLASPLDMTSLAEASSSFGTEGNLQATENPVPTGAGQNVGVAANGPESAADVQNGVIADRTQATPPNGDDDDAANAEKRVAANTDPFQYDSPIFAPFPSRRR